MKYFKYMVTVDGAEFAMCQGMSAVMEVWCSLKPSYPTWRLGLLKYNGQPYPDDIGGASACWEPLI